MTFINLRFEGNGCDGRNRKKGLPLLGWFAFKIGHIFLDFSGLIILSIGPYVRLVQMACSSGRMNDY